MIPKKFLTKIYIKKCLFLLCTQKQNVERKKRKKRHSSEIKNSIFSSRFHKESVYELYFVRLSCMCIFRLQLECLVLQSMTKSTKSVLFGLAFLVGKMYTIC